MNKQVLYTCTYTYCTHVSTCTINMYTYVLYTCTVHIKCTQVLYTYTLNIISYAHVYNCRYPQYTLPAQDQRRSPSLTCWRCCS